MVGCMYELIKSNQIEEKGREERRGSAQAGKEGRSRGEREGEMGQGWPTKHGQ
jgi:hypothetical protein